MDKSCLEDTQSTQLGQRLINGAPKYGNDEDSVDALLVRAYQTYIDELKQYHNPRYGRGPIGGNYYVRRGDDGDPGRTQGPHPAGGRREPGLRHRPPRPDGGHRLGGQAADGGHSRRRAAEPEA